MAWGFLRQNNYTDDTTYSTSTITLAVATVNGGSLLVLCINIIDGSGANNDTISSITDSASNTWAKAVDSQFAAHGYYSGMWYAANISSTAPTLTVNLNVGSGTSKQYSVRILEYSGLTSAPLDVVASLQTAAGTSFPTGTTAATAQANELAIATYADNQQAPAVTLPGGWTSRLNFTTDSTDLAIVEKDTGVIGTQSATFTSVSNHYATGLIATFTPATQIVVLPSGFFSSTDWPGPDDLVYRPRRPYHTPLMSSYVPPEPPPTPGVFLGFPFPHWKRPQRYRMDGPLMSSAAVTTQDLIVTITDTLSLTETVNRLFTGFRNATETLSISDSVLKEVGKFVTETLSISDSVARLFTGFRSTTETLSFSETVARLYAGFRSVTETLSITDATRLAINKLLSDTLSISDTVTRLFTGFRSVTETLTLIETVARLGTFFRSISETLTLTESVVRGLQFIRTITDTLSISDTVARLFSGFRSATETLTLTETVARLFTGFRSLTETLSTTDTVQKAVGKLVTDTLSLSDTVVRRLTAFRSLTETLTLTETVARLGTFFRSMMETLSLSESVVRGLIFLRSVTETLSISDTVVRLFTGFRTVTETLSLADTIARLGTFFRSASETLTLSESVVRGLIFLRTATETLSISDTVVRLYTGFRSIAETLTLTETVVRLLTAFRTLTETLTLSESVVRVKGAIRAVIETLSISDSVVRLYGALRTANETVTLSETVARRYTGFRSAIETLTLSETAARLATIRRALTDTLAVSDTVIRLGTFIRLPSETVVLSDTVARVYHGFRLVTETISGLTDSVVSAINALVNPAKTFIAPQRSLTVTAPMRSMNVVGPIRNLSVLASNRALTASAMSYLSTVLADNPIGYWRLADSGTIAIDMIGNGHPGTLHGGIATGVGGAITDNNAAMSFDGSSGYITTGWNPYTGLPGLTLEAWVNHQGVAWSAGQEMVIAGGNITKLSVNNGKVHAEINLGGLSKIQEGATVPTAGWHHLLMTWNGTSLIPYLDGVAGATGGPFTGVLNGPPLIFGSNSGVSLFFLNRLDELAIYNYALTPAQVTAHYNAGLGTSFIQSSTVVAPIRLITFMAVPE